MSVSISSFAAVSLGFVAATPGSSKFTAAPISTRSVPPYRGRRAVIAGIAPRKAKVKLIATSRRDNISLVIPSFQIEDNRASCSFFASGGLQRNDWAIKCDWIARRNCLPL